MATQTENSKISHFRGTWFQGYFYRVEKLLSAEKFTQWRNFLYLYLSLSWLGQCHKRPRNFHRSIIETKYKQSVLESSALFSQISHVNVVFDWSRQSREWAGVRGKGMCKCDLKNELPFLKKSQVIFIICCHFNSMYQYPVCLNLNTDLFFFPTKWNMNIKSDSQWRFPLSRLLVPANLSFTWPIKENLQWYC